MRVRSRRARVVLAGVAVLLPERLRRGVHTRLLGHSVDRTARIGLAFVDVDRLEMGPHARIGHLVALRGCDEVVLGESAEILMLVWVNAQRRDRGDFVGRDRRPELRMGRHSLISSLHFVDACDLVELADFACLAGFGSIVQTHAIDFVSAAQDCAPVRLHEYAFVGSRALLLPGAEVPAGAVVAGGAVVTRALEGRNVFGGVPARPIRENTPGLAWFHRDRTDRR